MSAFLSLSYVENSIIDNVEGWFARALKWFCKLRRLPVAPAIRCSCELCEGRSPVFETSSRAQAPLKHRIFRKHGRRPGFELPSLTNYQIFKYRHHNDKARARHLWVFSRADAALAVDDLD